MPKFFYDKFFDTVDNAFIRSFSLVSHVKPARYLSVYLSAALICLTLGLLPAAAATSMPEMVTSTDSNSSVNIDVLGKTPGTVNLEDSPSNGTTLLEADNTITYTPNANYVGQDSFSYKIIDADGKPMLGTIKVKVGCTDCSAEAQLTLSWDPNSENILGYRIYHGPTSGTVTKQLSDLTIASGEIDDQAPSVTYDAGTELGLQAGDLICFQIKAYNNSGESDSSEPICTEI